MRKKVSRYKFIVDDWLKLKKNPYMMILILTSLPLIYFLVYTTGGIKFSFSHTMYVPIILAGLFYGRSYGMAIAFFAGILLGPLMPIDTQTNEMQLTINWVYRLIVFILIGAITGYASTKLRKDAESIKDLMSLYPDTKVPNTNFLRSQCKDFDNIPYSIFTVIISNHHNIIDIFGIELYHKLVNQTYVNLLEKLPKKSSVVQSDSNKLWVIIPQSQIDYDLKLLVEILNNSKRIKDILLYVNFSIGGNTEFGLKDCQNFSVFDQSNESARLAEANNILYILENEEKTSKRSEYELLANLEDALKNGQIYLVYQPKFDIKTSKPIGFESLIRWNHPTRGNIPPDVFIPLVEETNLIHLLTEWVLRTTLIKIKELMVEGYNVPISINISGKNLYDPNFYDKSLSIINKFDIPNELIELELTESTLMVNPDESKKTLHKFVSNGIKVALDDFGSGYSSLAYLTKFPINYIKLDRLFMANIDKDPHMSTIVQSTILLSKNLGYQVVCEGVETIEVLNMLKEFGCDYAQGYYYARPMASENVVTWYKNNN